MGVAVSRGSQLGQGMDGSAQAFPARSTSSSAGPTTNDPQWALVTEGSAIEIGYNFVHQTHVDLLAAGSSLRH